MTISILNLQEAKAEELSSRPLEAFDWSVNSANAADSFRLAMRRMAATVSIITTEFEGVPYGMTATAVSAVSVSPPSLLIAVNQSASIHNPLRQAGAFWLNLLSADHGEHCSAFSGRLQGAERFTCGEWRRERGMPLLTDAQAGLLCEVDKEIPYATHTIFIAQVIETRVGGPLNPLVYFDGRHQNGA
jgi:flavin reductase